MRTVGGRDHRGRTAVRQRRVVGRAAWPDRRVPRLHAVRRHTVRVRGPGVAGQPAQLHQGVRSGADHVRRDLLFHARVARAPVRERPVRAGSLYVQVSVGRARLW